MTATPQSSGSLGASAPSVASVSPAPAWLHRLGLGEERWFGLALLMAAMALWFMPRSYVGVRHDGMLYLAQALRHQWPTAFSADLFFQYGSQDTYSLYSSLFAGLADLTSWVGMTPALLLVCQFAFVLSLALLLRQLLPAPLAALGVALASASPYYGGFAIFSYGEGFLTARSLAEPLVLAALWAMLCQRNLLWVILLVLATLLHPLIALVGLGIAYVWLAERRPWLWSFLPVPLVVFVLSYYGVPGLELFTQIFDDEWWAALGPNAPVFPQRWHDHDWAKWIFDVVVLFAVGRLAAPQTARLARAVLLIAASGMLVALVGGEILRLVLVSQAQLWRAQWVAHLLACGLFPWLVWRLRERGPYAWIGCALLFATLAFRVQATTVYAASCGALALWAASRFEPPVTRAFTLFAVAVIAFILGGALVNDFAIAEFLGISRANETMLGQVQRLFEFPASAMIVMLGGVLLAARWPRATLVLGLASMIAVLSVWDQRGAWLRYIEASIVSAHPLARNIPEDGQVYWPGDLQAPWFLLKRPAYFNQAQASGLIFSRQTALEFQRRADAVNVLEVQAELCRKIGVMMRSCTPSSEALQEVCGAVSGPDFIVLPARIEPLVSDRWSIALSDGSHREYNLYSCKDILARLGSPHVDRD